MKRLLIILITVLCLLSAVAVPASAETVQELVTRSYTGSDIYSYFSGNSDVKLVDSMFYYYGDSDLIFWISEFETDMGTSICYEVKGNGTSSYLKVLLLSASGTNTSTNTSLVYLNSGEHTFTATRSRTIRNVGIVLPLGEGISEFTVSYYVEVDKPTVNDVSVVAGFLSSLWNGIWNVSGQLWVMRAVILIPVASAVVFLLIHTIQRFNDKKIGRVDKHSSIRTYRDFVSDNSHISYVFLKVFKNKKENDFKRLGYDVVSIDNELYYSAKSPRFKRPIWNIRLPRSHKDKSVTIEVDD